MGGRGRQCVHGADGRSGADDAVGRTSGRGGKAADGRADGGGKGADSGADGRTGPTRRRHADRQKRRGRGPGGADGARTAGWADGRTGRLGGLVEWTDGVCWLGGLGRTGVLAIRRSGGLADGRTSGWAWV